MGEKSAGLVLSVVAYVFQSNDSETLPELQEQKELLFSLHAFG